MPKIARDFFAELELCRVEMVGGEKFPGAKINLNAYLNAQAKKGIDNKVPPFNPLAANLWLKQLNGETLLEDSKNAVNAFLSSISINIDNLGNQLIQAQNSQEDFQSIALDLMKDLDLMQSKKQKVTRNPMMKKQHQKILKTQMSNNKILRRIYRSKQLNLRLKARLMKKVECWKKLKLQLIQCPLMMRLT